MKMEAARRVLTVRRAYQGEVRAVAEQAWLIGKLLRKTAKWGGLPVGWLTDRKPTRGQPLARGG
jgi:hypothetical protein